MLKQNKIDVTVTPHSQCTAPANQSEGITRTLNPGTPPVTPHHHIPRFELPGQASLNRTPTNSQVGDDPFITIQNNPGQSSVDVTVCRAAATDDTNHDNPYLVYPLPPGRCHDSVYDALLLTLMPTQALAGLTLILCPTQ